MLSSLDWQLQKKVRTLIACSEPALTERVWAFLEQGSDTRPIGTALTGRECLEMIKNQAPDVLLIADGLPGEEVLDICREAIHIHPRIAPVILAQTQRYRDPEYLHQAIGTGVCHVLQVEPPYDSLRYQHIADSVMQAYNLIQERVSGVGGGIGRMVTLFSLKGGVGKTTLAAALAHLLAGAETRQRVILADFNWRFGNLDAYLGHTASQSVLDLIPVLDAISRTDLESIAPPVNANLRLLPAPLDIERAEFTRDLLERDMLEDDRATLIDNLLMSIREERAVQIGEDQIDFLELLLKKEKVKQILSVLARRTIQSLRRNYHYIVADTGGQIDDVTLTTLEMSDLVVLVCTPDVPSVRATRAAIALLGELGIHRESIGYVLNRSARAAEIKPADIQALFGGYELLGEIPSDFAALQPFANGGAVVTEAGPALPINRAFQKLAATIGARVPVARAL
ncbi:MAG TPA: AAA family ATPase [Roseiflexaceae bacterium]|nr:AAA family ATPase [Roseiflexaceae bacterium]